MIDHTHDVTATSWVAGADTHADFPVQNLPLGVFSPAGGTPRIGTAIGDYVLDLAAVIDLEAVKSTTLNALFSVPSAERLALRHSIFALLTDETARAKVEPHLYPASAVTMHLPARVGDYTDFYVGIHHATNIGKLFRPDNPLLPNYKHIPIGYHGRASSVMPSGTPVIRPHGQRMPPGAEAPVFGPSTRLDYELELGVWIAGENALGTPVPIADAPGRIAGFSLLNDWSARDIQAWEYQPLGPFLAKNFLTSVSPWVVTAEALAPFMTAQAPRPAGDPQPLAYLMDAGDQANGALGVELEVSLTTAAMRAGGKAPHLLSHGPATNMYWTVAQMIAQHTVNGCNLMPGDLLGTGTISGPEAGSFGSLMEISEGGRVPVQLPSGESRTFLEGGDEVIFNGRCARDGYRSIGFGNCRGTVQ